MSSTPLVFAFHPDGEIEYTRNSTFSPFDGRGEMERVTDIRKSPSGNEFYIHWMRGPNKGRDHTYGMSIAYGAVTTCPAVELIMTFPSYELAVAHEVTVLNAMRRKGISFNDSSE